LESLSNKSLLRHTAGTPGGDRYAMLETMREYALERLTTSGEVDGVARRHAAHFVGLAERAETHLRGEDQGPWLDWLEVEHANMREALRWGVERGRKGEVAAATLALRLGAALWRFWWVRGHASEGRQWLAEALEAAEARRNAETPPSHLPGPRASAVRAEAAFGAGMLAWIVGDLAEARARYEDSLALWRAIGDREGSAYALMNLAEVAWCEGDRHATHALHAESLALFREMNDRRGVAWALSSMGLTMIDDQEADPRAPLEESVSIFRDIGEALGASLSLQFLGLALVVRGAPAVARQPFMDALATQHRLHDLQLLAVTMHGLAAVAGSLGENVRAARLLGVAAAIDEAAGYLVPWQRLRLGLEPFVAAARHEMGDAAFAAAMTEGQALSLEEAIAEALAVGETAGPPTQQPPESDTVLTSALANGAAGPLTVREAEVAALVAEGLSNREIGERLFITAGTAGVHVVHILNKLGLRSRAQIAAWAAARGLGGVDIANAIDGPSGSL
jgi:non-specific serine/threonine protein kinase